MTLAIFDLDNTLIGGDSDHAWGEFLCNNSYVDAAAYRQQNDAFYDDYCRGELDINAYQRFALAPLVGQSGTQLAQWHQEFMQEAIQPLWLEKSTLLLDKHKEQGDFLLIITATNRFITQAIAEHLGVDDLIATEPEIINGQYTGEISGTPCFQNGKIVRLQQWLEKQERIKQHLTLEGSYFYSDSHNDLPLLEQVTNPIAVDPDDILRQHAENKGWDIISLR